MGEDRGYGLLYINLVVVLGWSHLIQQVGCKVFVHNGLPLLLISIRVIQREHLVKHCLHEGHGKNIYRFKKKQTIKSMITYTLLHESITTVCGPAIQEHTHSYFNPKNANAFSIHTLEDIENYCIVH